LKNPEIKTINHLEIIAGIIEYMSDFQLCNVCQHPGTFDNTLDVKQIPSNLRKFKEQKFTVWRCSSCHSLHSKESVDLNYYYENYIIGKQGLNYFFSLCLLQST
jgi:hypothetical protein